MGELLLKFMVDFSFTSVIYEGYFVFIDTRGTEFEVQEFLDNSKIKKRWKELERLIPSEPHFRLDLL